MSVLEVRDLVAGYGDVQILWGASLEVCEGCLTTIVGSNGAGKTTLLRSVMSLLRPSHGQVRFEGRDVTGLSPHEKAELGLVLIPEGRQLFTEMTVLENLEMGATPKRARGRERSNLERVFSLFPRLKERMGQRAGTLSGGEQQMAAIARGIMAEPRLLMLDEPSLGLSPLLVQNLHAIVRQLQDSGLSMLLVEQNVHLALAVADFAYVLSQGRIDLAGPAAEVRQMERVRQAYLGI
ncbi:MAG TPA: ABC transporter ATP-binding protein [Anaerolineae bacterium]